MLNNEGVTVRPRIQLPGAFSDQEIARLLPLVRDSINEASIYDFQSSTEAKQRSLQSEIGISITVPRACLRADRFANLTGASFVTIDTDELTQTVFGTDSCVARQIMVTFCSFFSNALLIPSSVNVY